MNRLFDHINSRIDISEKEFELISKNFKRKIFKKKDVLIKPGQFANFHFFVIHGCLRSYFIDTIGKEHTVQFAVENWWIGDYTSYFGNEKSILFVECIEDCELLQVEKHHSDRIFHELPKFETYIRINLERYFASSQKKTIGNLSLNSKDRYSIFRTTYPNIEQRVKNYHIASYLGMTPETLSRVRSEY